MNLTSFFLDQHGCAKNQVDGELIIAHLTELGLQKTDDASKADVIIINSCGFIESAKKESLDSLMNARRAYPNTKIVLAGCLAQRYADLFKTELPEADALLGTGDISLICDLISELNKGNRPVIVPEQNGVCVGDRKELLSFPGSAFVKITEGCNNCCSFCAIPIIRGSLRSRSIVDVVSEIKTLVSRGIFEINLVGQDLAAYGTDFPLNDNTQKNVTNDDGCIAPPCGNRIGSTAVNKSALRGLLTAISALQGNFCIRLLYIHPDHFSDNILPIIASDKRILPYFDIPFQSGDDTVIRTMNRKGTAQQYLELARKIRDVLPEAVIRTTFLTGFPGETAESFNNTVEFLQKLQCDWSGCFEYSKEDGTPASLLKKSVPKKTAKARAAKLQEIQNDITEKRIALHKGKIYSVLIEEVVDGDEGLAIGRAWFQAPDVDGAVVIRYDKDDSTSVDTIKSGNLVDVKITGVTGVDLDSIFLKRTVLPVR